MRHIPKYIYTKCKWINLPVEKEMVRLEFLKISSYILFKKQKQTNILKPTQKNWK